MSLYKHIVCKAIAKTFLAVINFALFLRDTGEAQRQSKACYWRMPQFDRLKRACDLNNFAIPIGMSFFMDLLQRTREEEQS